MRAASQLINGYPAHWVAAHGHGDVTRYGFGLGDSSGDAAGSCVSTGCDLMLGQTTDNCGNLCPDAAPAFPGGGGGTLPKGALNASSANAPDANGITQAMCSGLVGAQWVNGTCVNPSNSTSGATGVSTTQALVFLAVAVGVVFMVR